MLAGILASGGVFAWEIGGDTRVIWTLAGAILGGLVAGAVLGRYSELAIASVAAACPLGVVGVLGVVGPGGIGVELAVAIVLIAAAGQGCAVLFGGAFGIEAGRWLGIGPVRSVAATVVLALGAGVVAAGWFWFALTIIREM
jgi:hypothetical protein